MKGFIFGLLSGIIFLPAFSQTYTSVATFAGSGSPGLLDGPLATAMFNHPYGVCSDSTGAIYVADCFNNCIRKIQNGNVTTVAGNGSAGDVDAQGVNARLNNPTGVYFKNGYLYISDNLNNKIKRMDAAGNVVTIAGSGTWGFANGPALSAAFKEPKSLVVDNNNIVYVADYENHCIRKIANGQVTTYAGTGGVSGDVLGPAASARFYRPRDLCIDATGNIYVVDLMNNKVKVISTSGIVSLVAGSGANGNTNGTGASASFSRPVGIDWYPSGDLCVLSAVSPMIRTVTVPGVATSLAGTGVSGYLDGPVASAKFNLPQDICFDPFGNLYVGDDLNNVIRILTSNFQTNFLGNDIVSCVSQPAILSVNFPGATYQWSNGSTNDSIMATSSGIYWVDVMLSGDTLRDSITVTFVSLSASAQVNANVNCFAGNTGSATITAAGGSGNYTYSWLPFGGNTATANNLSAGTYSCTINDPSGCSFVQTVTITQPPQLALTSATTSPACNGYSDGSAFVTVNGGSPGYSYNWMPFGGNSDTASALTAGTYTVVITDVNSCSITSTLTVTQPALITSSAATTASTCFGASDGSSTLSVTGGTPGYSFQWQPTGGTSNTASNLIPGSYTCQITDQHGCTIQQSVTITEPSQISVTPASTNVLCGGTYTGSAAVGVTGGTGPYNYSWVPVTGTGSSLTGLAAGSYTVTITDANNCIANQQFNITQPPPLVLAVGSDSICPGDMATVLSAVSGGVGPYAYAWSDGSSSSSLSVSPAQTGNYTLVVSDANNCQASQITTISVMPAPVAAISSNAPNNLFSLSVGSELCFSDLSSNAVSWQWDLNGTFSTMQNPPCISLTPSDTGWFCTRLIITGTNGCKDSSSICIYTENINYTIPNVFTPNGDGINDIFFVTNEGMKELRCSIYNRWGELLYSWDSPQGSWDGRLKDNKQASDGTYYYVISMTDFTGKTYNKEGFVQLLHNSY